MFCYEKQLLCKWDEFDIYHLKSDGIARYTLLETKGIRSPSLLQPLMNEEILVVHALDQFSYERDGESINAFLYTPFTPFDAHLCSTRAVLDSNLRQVMKALIEGLLHLDRCENIGSKLLVVQEGRIGCIMYTLEAISTQNDCVKDFATLQAAIGDPNRFSQSFQILYGCLKEARSKERCRRLLRSPYFLSNREKVYCFISLLHLVINSHKRYENGLKGKKISSKWTSKVRGKYVEIDAILDRGRGYRNEDIHFIRFLRNCIQHLNEHKRKLDPPGPSKLLSEYKILEVIDEVKPEFLDSMFSAVYKIKGRNPLLDDE